MKKNTTLLAFLLTVCLFSCDRSSSPEGRSKLRDNELSEKIEQLNKKQLVILDSLQILDQKIEALKKSN